MSEIKNGNARCLCGAVHITANNVSTSIGSCHCSMCRKWSGGPIMTVDCGSDVSFTGEENITIYNSSAWAERGFCNKCGSHLFYHLKESNQYMILAGLFDENKSFIFDHQVFIDEKPDYYSFSNQTENMTGAEVFEKYAPPQE